MVEGFVEKNLASEYLRKWVTEANYELLPTEKALKLVDVVPKLNSISVTSRPTGIEDTIKFVEILGKEKAGRVSPHIAARRIINQRHFDEVALRLLEAGTKKVFVMGGDGEPFGSEFKEAEDVLAGFYKRGVGFEKIGIGGYPEGNPVMDMDPTELLLRKQELAEMRQTNMEIVTQMCFDVDVLIDWLLEIRRRGVYLPVRIGVPGSLKLDTLIKVLSMLGVSDMVAFLKSKPVLARSLAGGVLGGFTPGDLLKELSEKNDSSLGINGISVFTLGNVSSSVKCLANLLEEV